MKRDLNLNLYGNEIYYTNYLILLVKNMLCSKILCQKGFNSILFSYKIRTVDVVHEARGAVRLGAQYEKNSIGVVAPGRSCVIFRFWC